MVLSLSSILLTDKHLYRQSHLLLDIAHLLVGGRKCAMQSMISLKRVTRSIPIVMPVERSVCYSIRFHLNAYVYHNNTAAHQLLTDLLC